MSETPAVTEWAAKMLCLIVEHDEATGKPLPGGRAYPATVTAVAGEVVYADLAPGYPNPVAFDREGWPSPGPGRHWRLTPANQEDAATGAAGTGGQR